MAGRDFPGPFVQQRVCRRANRGRIETRRNRLPRHQGTHQGRLPIGQSGSLRVRHRNPARAAAVTGARAAASAIASSSSSSSWAGG